MMIPIEKQHKDHHQRERWTSIDTAIALMIAGSLSLALLVKWGLV